jgi:hypothetical protein
MAAVVVVATVAVLAVTVAAATGVLTVMVTEAVDAAAMADTDRAVVTAIPRVADHPAKSCIRRGCDSRRTVGYPLI